MQVLDGVEVVAVGGQPFDAVSAEQLPGALVVQPRHRVFALFLAEGDTAAIAHHAVGFGQARFHHEVLVVRPGTENPALAILNLLAEVQAALAVRQ
ncbi:hypothetical protein D9M71_229340 [compost metagenome]